MDNILGNSKQSFSRAFTLGIAINAIYVIVEVFAGIYYNSLSLISDAGHNLSDVATLGLAMVAFRLSKVRANGQFTYGLKKSTILVSLINSVILFVVIGGILWESIMRFLHPVSVYGQAISAVAGVGIVVNTLSALLFVRYKEHDLNVKGAFLHLIADAVVSLGVVVSGLLIVFFGIYWLDMAMSLAIVVVIFYSTWKLFRESLFLTLDGVPRGIDLNKISEEILSIPGVIDVHHIHVWALSTMQNALTAHVVVNFTDGTARSLPIKQLIKTRLAGLGIQHVTLELEEQDTVCTSEC